MNNRGFLWLVLKKLPIILAVLVAPITLALVINFNPSMLRLFNAKPSADPTVYPQFNKTGDVKSWNPDAVQRSFDPDGTGFVSETGHSNDQSSENSVQPFITDIFDDFSMLPPADWESEAASCSSPQEFVELAKRAKGYGEHELADGFFREALSLDPENWEAREGTGQVSFDPEYHLKDFKIYEGRQMEWELKRFRKLRSKWLVPDELAKLRSDWEQSRKKLEEVVAYRENDPFDDRRRSHLRRLMRDEFFTKLIGKGDFWVDRSHLPFHVFFQGDEKDDHKKALLFLDAVAADMKHLLSLYKSLYMDPGSTSPDSGLRFFVWILDAEEFDAVYVSEDDMLVIHRTGGLSLEYAGSEELRRIVLDSFSLMLAAECTREERENPEDEVEPPAAWIELGVPCLLTFGKGVDSQGRLNLNGAGIREVPSFSDWLGLTGGSWPIPLTRLLDFQDRAELWRACMTNDLVRLNDEVSVLRFYQGAVAACALFCRHMLQGPDPETFREYVSEKLRGRETVSEVRDLVSEASLEEVEKSITIRYARSGPGK